MKIKVCELIEPMGGFFEVYVSTSIKIYEQRDRKGLYAKAHTFVRRGIRDMLTMFVPNGKRQENRIHAPGDRISADKIVWGFPWIDGNASDCI